jgi:hypothetical protein
MMTLANSGNMMTREENANNSQTVDSINAHYIWDIWRKRNNTGNKAQKTTQLALSKFTCQLIPILQAQHQIRAVSLAPTAPAPEAFFSFACGYKTHNPRR